MFRSHTSSAKNHNLSQRNGKAYNALCRLYICALSSYDLPKDLLHPLVIPLDHDHDGIAGFEIRVLVMERISAHDDVVMCRYSFHYEDSDFKTGDTVMVVIQRYDEGMKQIFGKIVGR